MKKLQEAVLEGLSVIKDETASVFSTVEDKYDLAFLTARSLFYFKDSRSQTISFLTSHHYSWDAEIILRSFYESTAKILFICFSPTEERRALCYEYWVLAGSVSARRRARHAEFAKAVFHEDAFSASVFSSLQDDGIWDLSARVSKVERRNLERKWSFVEIISRLKNMCNNGIPLRGIDSLIHMYDTASHLLHADREALDLLADRATRSADEVVVLAACHVARIWSDQFYLSLLCLSAAHSFAGQKFAKNTKITDIQVKIELLNDPLVKAFEASQRDFYGH